MVQAYALFVHDVGLARATAIGGRSVLSRADGVEQVSQVFRMRAGGLAAVVLHVEGDPNARLTGHVVLELSEIVGMDDGASGGTPQRLYREIVPAQAIAASPSFEWRFPPIAESLLRHYRIDATMVGDVPIGFWALRDDEHREGAAFVNGREQWGDLVFETAAGDATAFGMLRHLLRDAPLVFRSPVTIVGIWLLYNAAAFLVLYSIVFGARARRIRN